VSSAARLLPFTAQTKENFVTNLGKQIVVVVLVVVVAFVLAWTSTGLWSGIGIAVALGIAAALAVRSEEGGRLSCTPWRHREDRASPKQSR
jgi:fatty acid desaturase